MAAVPDFNSLAYQQQAANDEATRRSTWANRPDQSNAMGSTTWNQMPDGRWVNNTSLNGDTQNLFNATIRGQGNLSNQIGMGVDTGGLMGWGNTDLTRGAVGMPDSGFGASQQVIDAWNALNAPGLQKSEDAARARAAAMGLTLGSQASNDIERTLGSNRNDASNKAILAGTQEYQNVFNRGLASRQQTVAENTAQANMQNAMRQQQFGERTGAYDRAVSGSSALTSMRDSLNPNKWNTEVKAAAGYKPVDIYGAAGDTFSANVSNENIEQAKRNANLSAGSSLLNAAGGLSGVGGMLGSLWGGAKDLWNSWGGSQQGITDVYGYGDPSFGNSWGAPALGYTNAPVDYFGGNTGSWGSDWGSPSGGYDTSGLGGWGGVGGLSLGNW